jgi:hypothetical protein
MSPPGRLRDAAVLLPLAGLLLLVPPVIPLFVADVVRPFGLPAIVAYVFGVWLGLIGCAALIARRLRPPPR